MKWFAKNYSVCKECGVHFEPAMGSEVRWGDLCKTHRKDVKANDLKRDAVVAWAGQNWERLYAQYEKEESETRAAYNKMMQSQLGSLSLMAQQQAGAAAQSNPYGLGNYVNTFGNPFGL